MKASGARRRAVMGNGEGVQGWKKLLNSEKHLTFAEQLIKVSSLIFAQLYLNSNICSPLSLALVLRPSLAN